MITFDVEHTDTFGGEANYSWVTRGSIEVGENSSDRKIISAAKKVLNLQGWRHRKTDVGEIIRLDLVGACQVVFITPRY